MGSRTIMKVVLAGFGVLCLLGAGLLAWVVVPGRAELPAKVDETRHLAGTAKLLLNQQALASGDLANALLRDVPVTLENRVQTVAVDGDVAQLRSTSTLSTADGTPLGGADTSYAVNRRSMMAAADHPENWSVLHHRGLALGFPIGVAKKDYEGWFGDIQSTAPLRYVRSEKRGGIDAYVYQATVPTTPIKDETTLAALPRSVSPRVLAGLAGVLPLPAPMRAQLTEAVPYLTSDVGLTYAYEGTITYWVEPSTGAVVDVRSEDVRRVGLELPGGQSVPPSITVYDVSLAYTDSTVQESAADARDGRDALALYGTTLPLVLLVVGILAVLAAVLLVFTGRPGRMAPPPAPMPAG